jgi:antitoxin ParD1/3/4
MVFQWTTDGEDDGRAQTECQLHGCSFQLRPSGEYPNISAAVSGEMARARAARERERLLFEAEVQRRLALPIDAWEPVRTGECITSGARTHHTRLTKAAGGTAA